MRLNYDTVLAGSKAVLVPYRPEHVPTYHKWMLDSHLLEMTGSEPLTMEEEIDMQQTWRDDETKCTFIVLATSDCESLPITTTPTVNDDGAPADHASAHPAATAITNLSLIDQNLFELSQNLKAMVGDVNLFFHSYDNDEDSIHKTAELDVMTASVRHRRSGIGSEAVRIMMQYGHHALGVTRFYVKIKEENEASLNMFENTLCFVKCGYAACFKEVELEYIINTNGYGKELPAVTLFGFKLGDI
mmetsp:Transcript_14144/g.21727  ORF Transcript_14144/g.21727 Transcript_14144/m.21727 type:complete len:245 (-) Transcript_14144:194-928(-)